MTAAAIDRPSTETLTLDQRIDAARAELAVLEADAGQAARQLADLEARRPTVERRLEQARADVFLERSTAPAEAAAAQAELGRIEQRIEELALIRRTLAARAEEPRAALGRLRREREEQALTLAFERTQVAVDELHTTLARAVLVLEELPGALTTVAEAQAQEGRAASAVGLQSSVVDLRALAQGTARAALGVVMELLEKAARHGSSPAMATLPSLKLAWGQYWRAVPPLPLLEKAVEAAREELERAATEPPEEQRRTGHGGNRPGAGRKSRQPDSEKESRP